MLLPSMLAKMGHEAQQNVKDSSNPSPIPRSQREHHTRSLEMVRSVRIRQGHVAVIKVIAVRMVGKRTLALLSFFAQDSCDDLQAFVGQRVEGTLRSPWQVVQETWQFGLCHVALQRSQVGLVSVLPVTFAVVSRFPSVFCPKEKKWGFVSCPDLFEGNASWLFVCCLELDLAGSSAHVRVFGCPRQHMVSLPRYFGIWKKIQR